MDIKKAQSLFPELKQIFCNNNTLAIGLAAFVGFEKEVFELLKNHTKQRKNIDIILFWLLQSRKEAFFLKLYAIYSSGIFVEKKKRMLDVALIFNCWKVVEHLKNEGQEFYRLSPEIASLIGRDTFTEICKTPQPIPSLQMMCCKFLVNHVCSKKFMEINKILKDVPLPVVRQIFLHVPLTNYSFYEHYYYSNAFSGSISVLQFSQSIHLREIIQNVCRENNLLIRPNYIPFLSVFNDRHRFQFEIDNYESSTDCLLFRKDPRPTQGFSVVNAETFIQQFDVFTEGMFRQFKNWNNIIIAGGSIAACLLPIPEEYSKTREGMGNYYHEIAYKGSDIDIFFYGLTQCEFYTKCEDLIKHFERINKKKCIVVQTPNTITIVSDYPKKQIQLVHGIWKSWQDIIINGDIDACCVSFNGKQVIATPRSQLAFNRRLNIIQCDLWKIRGSPFYEERLLKYSLRGFAILDPSISQFKHLLPSKIAEILKDYEEKKEWKVGPSSGLYGLVYLYLAHHNPSFMSFVLKQQVIPTIPYGKEWTPKLIETRINEKGDEAQVDGYGNSRRSFQILDSSSKLFSSLRLVSLENQLEILHQVPSQWFDQTSKMSNK